MAAELVSGAEIGRRLGVSREAVRQWRGKGPPSNNVHDVMTIRSGHQVKITRSNSRRALSRDFLHRSAGLAITRYFL